MRAVVRHEYGAPQDVAQQAEAELPQAAVHGRGQPGAPCGGGRAAVRSGAGFPAARLGTMMWLMQVADGVFKVDGVRVANVYLVVTGDGLLLVDTGMPGSARRVLGFIERIGRQPRELHDIVLTHCDIDHVGSVAELKRLTGARVAIHERDAPVLSGERRPEKGGLALAALYRLLRCRAVAPDLTLRDGDMIGGFQVMHMPGHICQFWVASVLIMSRR